MTDKEKLELLKKVLAAAVKTEDDLVDLYDKDGKTLLARERFYRGGGIKYALDLVQDDRYLTAQADILEVQPARKPAPRRDIDGETAQILEIERELRKPRVYHPRIEAMRQKGIG